MKQKNLYIYLITLILFLVACEQAEDSEASVEKEKAKIDNIENQALEETKPEIETKKEEEPVDLSLFDQEPKEWGENVTGVKTHFQTDEKEFALTFDACGGDFGSGFDEELISFLQAKKIPATLFINERWIHANESLFLILVDDPLFQIENHGTAHLPLSVNGGEAWNIPATRSVQEAHDEIMTNHETVAELTGEEMTLFRSGTAYYDEVAVELAEILGYTIVNFDILGDAGATYSAPQVTEALLEAKPGSIALMHMNQPTSGTAEGVKQAIPLLQEKGFEFVLLKDKELK